MYRQLPVAAVEAATALPLCSTCTRCEMSGLSAQEDGSVVPLPVHRPRTVCIPDEGAPGGVLLVGEGPGDQEDRQGRPFIGASGDLLRPLVKKWYPGPVAFANATRCRPTGTIRPDEKHVDACRGYLTGTIDEVRPERIVALGAWAGYALTGRSVSVMGGRRAYSYLVNGRFGTRAIPVYFVVHPAAALRNRFVRAMFQEDLEFALTRPRPPRPPLDAMVRVVETAADAARAVADARAAPWSAIDVESAGLLYDPSFRLLCLSVAPHLPDLDDESTWAWDEAALANPATREPLARWLAEASSIKTGQNVKFDEQALRSSGFTVRGVHGDTRLWRKLLDVEAPADLSSMAELVGMGGMKGEQQEAESGAVDRIRFGVQTERRLAKAKVENKKTGKLSPKAADGLAALADLDERLPHIAVLARNKDVDKEVWAKAVVDQETLLSYNARDGAGTRRLREVLPADLAANPPIDRIRRMVVDRAAHAVARLEEWGIGVDMNALAALDTFCLLKLADVRAKLDKDVGADFNPGSPKQLAELLFGRLKLKPPKTTPSGQPSTDEEVMESLRGKHFIADLILEHRQFDKIQSNYAGGMAKYVRPDGRIHCSILLDGARSGRASITAPALQTIPSNKRDPALGKMCRDVFCAPAGFKLVQADYKQVEFRVAAILSGDPVMRADILGGLDPHMTTAKYISKLAWGIPPEAVTDSHRSQAKTVVFGVLYGKTAFSLAREFGCSVDQAEGIINAVMGRYAGLAKWITANRRAAQKSGYVWTRWAGEPARRRPMFMLADGDDKRRTHAENSTTNHPVQGGANEFQVASLAALVEWIEDDGMEEDVKLLLPVHDSLLFEVRDDMVGEVVSVVRRIMTGHDTGGIPLDVDIETGQAWGSLQKYKAAA